MADMQKVKAKLMMLSQKMNTEQTFIIDGALYTVVPAAKGKLIYCTGLQDLPVPPMDNSLTLAAVISPDNTVHIIRGWHFGCFSVPDEELPAGFVNFSVGQTHAQAMQLFHALYDMLPPAKTILSGRERQEADNLAWSLALDPDHAPDAPEIHITKTDHYRTLLGIETVESLVNAHFAENRERYAKEKAVRAEAEKLLIKYAGNNDVLLYHALKESSANFVTAVFGINGVYAEGKIDPDVLRRQIRNQSDIGDYAFQTAKIGKGVFDRLFGEKKNHYSDRLRPADIIEIRYGTSTLYYR